MQHESKFHVFALELLVYNDNRVKKILVINALKNSDYFPETQTGLVGVSAVEVLMNTVHEVRLFLARPSLCVEGDKDRLVCKPGGSVHRRYPSINFISELASFTGMSLRR